MQRNNFLSCFILIYTSLLFNCIHSLVLTDLCPNTSCNCTLTDYTDLEIICLPTANLTQLPKLANDTLQATVTQLSVSSPIAGIRGPLRTLPTNISVSYPNIATLDLSFNAITGFLNTSKLASLGSNLLNVDFSNNFITNLDINFFQSNRQLQSIDLSQNNLTDMPMIDGETFVNFSSTITSMNFSYNQIVSVDLWPLFVKTGNVMTIDFSHNSIGQFTNKVPISLQQFTKTPELRYFYLNDNKIQRLSDLLLEQYGACSTTANSDSTAYFVIGISNILLTNNPLMCDCQSYNLITFIDSRITDFPTISNRSALLTQATCTWPLLMIGQKYLFANFTQSDTCANYSLPNITDIFCSVDSNETSLTLPPPTYWPRTTTVTFSTTVLTGNETTTNSRGGNGGLGSGTDGSSKSSSPSWYIILGIALGLALILFFVVLGVFLCRDRLLPKQCRSKLGDNNKNSKNSYRSFVRDSVLSSHRVSPSDGTKVRRASLSTSTYGSDDQDNRMLQLGNGRIPSHRALPNGHPSWADQNYPEQNTQAGFPITGSNPSRGPLHGRHRNIPQSLHHQRKLPLSHSTNADTNKMIGVKGIPIASLSTKVPPILSNGTIPDTDISELNVTSIPLAPSKRAKLLPQVTSGVYIDSKNTNLLNTSAGARVTNERQRRRSLIWSRRQHQNRTTPSPMRPQSMIIQKTDFEHADVSDEEGTSMPTMESLPNKSSKPVRTLPLLNITVVPTRIDDPDDQ